MLIGIVGKPSSGKSTFFKAATLINVKIASYPFTTIEPNQGIGFVRIQCVCKEFNVFCSPQEGFCINGNRFIPVKLLDVAGLVPGASKGKGMGNKFLNDLVRADALIHVVDASGKTDAEGNPCENYNSEQDIFWLENEIDTWFIEVVKRNLHKIRDDKKAFQVLSGLGIKEVYIEKAMEKFDILKETGEFAKELRKLSKPIVIACNKIDLPEAKENFKKISQKFRESIIIPCSAEAEVALRLAAEKGLIEYLPGDCDFTVKANLSPEQEKALEYIRENVLKPFGSTGVQEIINKAVFDILKYIAVFPVENEYKLSDSKGNILPNVFLLPHNSRAKDLAYKIHSDIGEGFLYAIDVRTKRRVGADYKLKHRDVISIVAVKK